MVMAERHISSARGGAAGLGLSLVHGFTAQSGGAMHLASQLGKGTVVTLWLPRAQQKDVRRVRAPNHASHGDRPKVEGSSDG